MNKILVIFIVLLLWAGLLFADKLNDSYNKLLSSYGKLSSWQANINQSNYFSQTDATLSSTGVFYYRKNRVAIRYHQPGEQVLLVRDGKITVYDKSARSAVRTTLTSSLQSLNPAEIVKAYWQQSKKTLVSSSDGNTCISLQPGANSQAREIRFTMKDKSGFINRLSYTDTAGNTVTVRFSGIKVNPSIPDRIWQLNLPKDVKLMEF